MTVTHALKPTGYDSELSEFEVCIFDGFSGKPIGWGFGIQQFLGEPRFNASGNLVRWSTVMVLGS